MSAGRRTPRSGDQAEPPARTTAAALWSRAADIHPGEAGLVLRAWLYAFCVLATNSLLKPLRDDVGVEIGAGRLAWSYTATFIMTAALHPLFAALVRRSTRRRLTPFVHRAYAIGVIGAFVLFEHGPAVLRPSTAFGLFAWISTLNLLTVSLFWGVMADTLRPGQARRLFGLLAVGATLGAAAGAAFVWMLAQSLNVLAFVGLAALLLEIGGRSAAALRETQDAGERNDARAAPRIESASLDKPASRNETAMLDDTDDARPSASAADRPIGGGAWAGVLHTLRSPYLLGISAYMLLLTTAATFTYAEQSRAVETHGGAPAARREYFARTELAVNSACLPVQLLLTGRLMAWLGVGGSAAMLPLVTAAGFALLASVGGGSVLSLLFAFQVLRRTSDYALSRPAREALFSVTPRTDKYAAKGFIDTFVYRGGDLLAIWVHTLWRDAAGRTLADTAILVGAGCTAWALLSLWLGHRHALALPRADRSA
ncbi:MAG: hypothetical protein IPM64_02330 [Phycisphaerales bacterium]|nr:hypothetical protein [Phycisphaerales bacterium]